MKLLTCVILATAFCCISALDCWMCSGQDDCKDPKQTSCPGGYCYYIKGNKENQISKDCMDEDDADGYCDEYPELAECLTCQEDLCN